MFIGIIGNNIPAFNKMLSKQKFLLAGKSTLSLLLAWAFIWILQGGLLATGAFLSNFKGHIEWHSFIFNITAQQWHLKQVISLFLFPEVIFLLLIILLPIRHNSTRNIPEILRLFLGWTSLLVLVKALWMPLWEIIHHTGIYYALSWLWLSGIYQNLIGIVLMIGFLLTVFRISAVFSRVLRIRPNQFLKSRDLWFQLIYSWFIPFVVLFLFILVFSGMKLLFPNSCLLMGIAVALLLNAPYISSYKVIVK